MFRISENQKKWFLFFIFLFGLFLIFKYVLPLFLPFIFALIIIAPIDSILERIAKKTHIGKSILAGVVVTLIIMILLAVISVISVYGFRYIKVILERGDEIEIQLSFLTNRVSQMIEKQFHINASQVESWMNHQLDQFLEDVQLRFFPKMVNKSVTYAKNIMNALIFVVVLWISSVLLAKDFHKMKEYANNNYYIRYIKNELKKLFTFLRTFLFAQILIMSSISIICAMGFGFAGFKIGTSLFIGIMTGILDALPFLGTGIILLPIAISRLFVGQTTAFIILFITFLISVVVRELLEPRLIGDKMGLWPIAILMSIYAGVKVFGGFGVILGPVYLVIGIDWYRNAEIDAMNGEKNVVK